MGDMKDAFYGGMCAALSVVAAHDNTVIYREIVALDPSGLLEFARDNRDVEMPAIRAAIRENRRRRSPTVGG